MFTTLIDPQTLAANLGAPDWVIVDCRFDLADPSRGEQLYLESHIPGARYAHLDRDLSGAKTGRNGRHPLPTVEQMRDRFGSLGIGNTTQVVVYDADTGMHASRLWWMLRFMGHDAVALLDGGFARWVREGHAVRGGREAGLSTVFTGTPREEWRISADEIVRHLADPEQILVDARAESRFRGENETIDKIAGHIPGARNYFFQRNLAEDKTFKRPDELRAEWRRVIGDTSPSRLVMYCGSGVTACHNLLALEHAGLSGARLFPGSWSEWSSDADRPVASGD
jgi:thiosulfate/3-mercaptopyruvate sulfurtransferase